MNKRLMFFSYGSGLASSIFSVRVKSSVRDITTKLDLKVFATNSEPTSKSHENKPGRVWANYAAERNDT
jgi:3-hydroxy-3-methylglutaryl CoA synthase